ncbi:hypothetical protein [Lentibacillus sp. Marseille-P4043]|uniref:hypothetical protein n=1 Tax=Lentibacillus sp. Marseille-P4043 TaxID=2040293 RepID=UPI000D0BB0E0|nr:hypothetical protein [Lentibacillus sp. Marseille-P4043]
MKKLFTVGLTCFALLFLVRYVYTGTEPTSTTIQQKQDKVPFENAKLIDSKIDGKTGVKVDVYTLEGWEK